MADLENGAVIDGGEEIVSTEPLSIRDSLKAALTGDDGSQQDGVTQERARDESGRFTAKAPDAQPAVSQPVAKIPEQQPVAIPVQQPAAAVDGAQPVQDAHKPPPGWSAEAKASFADLPPHVQAAVSKREQEIDNGFRVLQDYKGLEEFTPLIKQGNTTHAEVMRKALDYEKCLQANPIGMVMHVAKIGGIDIQALARAIVDGKIQLPTEPQPQQASPQPQVNVEQTVEQVLRKRDVDTQVNAFLADPANVHAEAVMDDMVALISAGRAATLKDAYDAACWMRPDIRQQLINQAAPQPAQVTPKANPADQARRAAKSITGSSAPGPSKDAGAGQPSSIRDSLQQAMSQQGSRA